jgi:ribonuclease PH
MEIQRLIGRALRSVVDLKKIGQNTIWIDCDVIQADGGTRTASIVGGFVALVDCLYRLYKGAVITSFPVTDFLGATSVGIWRGNYVLDLTYQEDVEVEVDMNIVMKASGEFVEVQGTAERGCFSKDDLDRLVELAKRGIDEIIDIERNLFKDILPNL